MTSHREILDEASRLTELLQGVKSSALTSLVGSFDGDVERLRRLLTLAAAGDGGHSRRGEGYGEQVIVLADALPKFLADTTVPADKLRAVFGWTARLLRVRDSIGTRSGRGADDRREAVARQRSAKAAGVRRPADDRQSGKASAGDRQRSFKTGLGGSNLAELAKFKRVGD